MKIVDTCANFIVQLSKYLSCALKFKGQLFVWMPETNIAEGGRGVTALKKTMA